MIKDLGRIAIIGRGEWLSGVSYEKLDVVTRGGSSYMATDTTSAEPPGTGWMLVASKGESFTYSDFTPEQIAILQKPATDAARMADESIGRVDEEHAKLKDLDDAYARQISDQAGVFSKSQNNRWAAFDEAQSAMSDAFEKSEAAREKSFVEASQGAKDATELANSAAAKAIEAKNHAESAAGKAMDAADSVDSSKHAAESAATAANTAAGSATSAAGSAGSAASAATSAAAAASSAATEAIKAAEEARGSISADKKICLAYETVGDTEYLTLIDTEEQ